MEVIVLWIGYIKAAFQRAAPARPLMRAAAVSVSGIVSYAWAAQQFYATRSAPSQLQVLLELGVRAGARGIVGRDAVWLSRARARRDMHRRHCVNSASASGSRPSAYSARPRLLKICTSHVVWDVLRGAPGPWCPAAGCSAWQPRTPCQRPGTFQRRARGADHHLERLLVLALEGEGHAEVDACIRVLRVQLHRQLEMLDLVVLRGVRSQQRTHAMRTRSSDARPSS